MGSLSRTGPRLPEGSSASAGGSKVQEELRKSCLKLCSMRWVTSTAGGLQEHLLCMVWNVGLSWAKVLSPAFQQLPRNAAVSTRMGDQLYPCGPDSRGGSNQHSRKDVPGGGNLSWPLPWHQTLGSGTLILSLIPSLTTTKWKILTSDINLFWK